jgi:diguanylate cyclase (GGDEF)-like protein/PAS domain S-box-containing protein
VDTSIRILLLEDSPPDAELAERELRKAQISFISKRVDTKDDFERETRDFSPDLILADFHLPQFTALEAIHYLKTEDLDIPVILFTGSLTEEIAALCIKQGADDYILKSKTARLPAAVISALNQKKAKREKEAAETALRHNEGYFRALMENALDIILVLRPDQTIRHAGPAIARLLGFRMEDIVGKNVADFFSPQERQNSQAALDRVLNAPGTTTLLEFSVLCRNGSVRILEGTGSNLIDHAVVSGIVINCHDVTERKQTEEALRGLSKAVETSQLGVTITDMDRKILYVNPAEARMHGYTVQELIGQDVRIFAPVELWKPTEVHDLKSLRRESRNICKDGRVFPVQLISDIVTDGSGKFIGIVTACEDITERKRMEEALRESEERFALAARGTNEGLWDWNLKTEEIFLSERWKSMLGFQPREIGSNPEEWFLRVHPEDRDRLKAEIEAHLKGQTDSFESEHRMQHKDGSYRWMLARGIAVHDKEDTPYRMAGSQTDITSRKIAEEQLLHDAFHDALTGLPNRALFLDRLKTALERTKRRESYTFAVLFLDLDRFKVVNDSLGHLVGDELLISVSKRLIGCLRPGDSVARLGGDEFALLLDDINNVVGAVRVANRIQNELKLAFRLKGHEIFTSASIGIALSSSGYNEPEEVLRDADTAMYRAKNLGRARHELFDSGMRNRAVKLMQVETDLRWAVNRHEFVPFYQPIVRLDTGRITGFEALLRWNHPDQGLLLPIDFVPVAEETGLIVPIGRQILRQACQQMKVWQNQFPPFDFSLSVNLSVKQFLQPGLIESLKEILHETEFDPAKLILEITESVLMENSEFAKSILLQLKQMKIQLHLDDFGTGFSSLSYLHRFPIDCLKIDYSFISGISSDHENTEIVRAIVSLARNLGLGVIAEGIETSEELAQLQSLGCGYGQGFFFSKAIHADSLSALIRVIQENNFLIREPFI